MIMEFYPNKGFKEREQTKTSVIDGKRWTYARSYTSRKEAEKELEWNRNRKGWRKRLTIREGKGFDPFNKSTKRKLYRIFVGPLDKRRIKK